MLAATVLFLGWSLAAEPPDQSSSGRRQIGAAGSNRAASGHAGSEETTDPAAHRLGYTIASYVASSRLHDNRHWLSDVTFGAAVGAIAGRTVTQHGRNYWTFAPAAVPGGVAFIVARTPLIPP